MKKMLFIYNPKAGKAQIRNKLADILDVFTKGDYEITVYPTQKSEDAMEKTRDRSKDYDIVVCSGGDGTLDEVVTGMIRSGFRTPIGYIPAGSTNDFGGSLGLPKNMVHAAETIVKGNDFACDVGSSVSAASPLIRMYLYISQHSAFSRMSPMRRGRT